MRILLAASLCAGCALSHGVRPVGEGTLALDVSVGGPIADYMGGYKPLPLSSVGVTYGLDDKTNLHGAFLPSTAALFGVVGLEVGASRLLLEQDGAAPALMADGSLIAGAGNLAPGLPDGGFQAWTHLSGHASWAYGKAGHLVYTGPEVYVQPAPFAAVSGLGLGHRVQLGRVGLGTELRWLAPFQSNVPPVVEYAGIAGRGAVSAHIGVQVAMGGK